MNKDSSQRQPPSPTLLWLGLALVGIAYATIIAILTAVNLTEDTGSLIRWVVQCTPLLVVLPGLLMRRYRAYSWLCFITILYFVPSVVKTMSPQGDWMDPVMLVCTLIIFFGSAMCSRWIQTINNETNSNASNNHHDIIEDNHD